MPKTLHWLEKKWNLLAETGQTRKLSRWFFILALAAFSAKEIGLIIAFGGDPLWNADGFSEANSYKGARYFVQNGFTKTAFLPVYPGYQFDTAIEEINKQSVYTHFLAGPEYVLSLSFLTIGDSWHAIGWTRLIPFLHVLVGIFLFCLACDRWVFGSWPWAKGWLVLFLGFTPAVRAWAINLHGHGYTSGYLLTALAMGVSAHWALKKPNRKWLYRAVAVWLGFWTNQMLLTPSFVVFFAPIAGSFLLSKPLRSQTRREPIILSFFIGTGLVLAFGIHYLQVVKLFGWENTWIDQFGTMMKRLDDNDTTSRIQLIGQYSNHVFSFFGISSIAMMIGSAGISFLRPGERASTLLASSIAFSASYCWIWFMKHHSVIHTHVNPRIFLILFAVFLAQVATLIAETRDKQINTYT